jgi:Domain of unknown function (DUF4116)
MQMTLNEFLKKVGGMVETIVSYAGKDALRAVEQNGYALRYVKEQTPEVCLRAVERNGDALQYVKEQTPEVCLRAVERNGDALRYVKEQTPEVCLRAVEQNGDALQYVNPSIFEPDGNTKRTRPCPHCAGSGTVEE